MTAIFTFTLLVQQQQQQQPLTQQGTTVAAVTGTPGAASTIPVVNGSSPPNPPAQQPSPGQMKPSVPVPSAVPASTTAPIAAATVPSSTTTPPVKNGTVTTGTQQLPSPAEPKQNNAGTPVLKPPPSVARPRPQPFHPSPFTRHMSLRYRSNPLSFMPLRNDTSGYETLTEEPAVPQLPPTVDTLMLQKNTPTPISTSFGTPVSQGAATQNSAPSQPPSMFNGLNTNSTSTIQSSNAIPNLSQRSNVPNAVPPLQPYPIQGATPPVNGSGSWNVSNQVQRQKPLSEAEMWLASASVDTAQPAKTVQPNQGLLTTVNPFAETSSQIDALSNAWTHDLQSTLPSVSSQGTTGWSSSSQWGTSTTRQTNGEDDFASFFASRQTSPPPHAPLSKKDSNPFTPTQDQVFWV